MRTDRFILPIISICVLSVPGTRHLFSSVVPGHGEAILWSTLWVVEEEKDEEERPPPPSRQNAILRAYFRSQYRSLRTEGFDLDETFLERYVDRQIDSFLEDIESRLARLRYWLARAEQAHASVLASTNPRAEKEEMVELATVLKEVDNTAGGLRGKLGNIFIQLDGKKKLPIDVNPADGFQEELTFLREQVDEAENRIRDYLFRTTNTIPYQSLKGENMMIRLYWAEKTADGIRDQIRR